MRTDSSLDIAQQIKSSLRIEEEFRADGCDLIACGRDFECCCPFHSEKTASCKIHPEQNYFKCFGCGAGGDVLNYISHVKFERPAQEITAAQFIEVLREGCARAGIDFPENKPSEPPKPRTIFSLEKLYACCEFQAQENGERVTQKNEYVNPDTKKIEAISIRFDGLKKRLLQATPNGDGFSFGLQGDGRKQPIWNRTRIRDVEIVVICEGETKVRLLQKREIVATCNLGGSKAAKKADWSPLIGKRCIIWRDNDDAGLQWQEDVIAELNALGIQNSCVDISTTALEKGDDVVDFDTRIPGDEVEKTEKIWDVLRASMPETMESQLAADANGTRYALKVDSAIRLTNSLCFLPGSITMLCGSAGSSKSFTVLQWIWQWALNGVAASILMLESGIVFHERRALAQMCGNNMLLNPEWVKLNPGLMQNILATFGGEIQRLRNDKVIQSPNDEKVDPEYLLRWFHSEWKRGRKISVADPVTMVETGDKFWQEQQDFLRELKRFVRRSQMRIILVTHPKSDFTKIDGYSMSGSKSFFDNSDSTFWLESHGRMEIIDSTYGETFGARYPYNRTMYALKHRFGTLETSRIGFYFDGGTLRIQEVGFLENA